MTTGKYQISFAPGTLYLTDCFTYRAERFDLHDAVQVGQAAQRLLATVGEWQATDEGSLVAARWVIGQGIAGLVVQAARATA